MNILNIKYSAWLLSDPAMCGEGRGGRGDVMLWNYSSPGVVCVDTRCCDHDGSGHSVRSGQWKYHTKHSLTTQHLQTKKWSAVPSSPQQSSVVPRSLGNSEHTDCLMNFHHPEFLVHLTVTPSFLIYDFIVLNIFEIYYLTR